MVTNVTSGVTPPAADESDKVTPTPTPTPTPTEEQHSELIEGTKTHSRILLFIASNNCKRVHNTQTDKRAPTRTTPTDHSPPKDSELMECTTIVNILTIEMQLKSNIFLYFHFLLMRNQYFPEHQLLTFSV